LYKFTTNQRELFIVVFNKLTVMQTRIVWNSVVELQFQKNGNEWEIGNSKTLVWKAI